MKQFARVGGISAALTFISAHVSASFQIDALTRATTYAIPAAKMEELLRRYETSRPRWGDFSGSYVYIGPWERELSDRRSDPRHHLRHSGRQNGGTSKAV